MELPLGVQIRRFQMHPDERGVFTEVFRAEWGLGIEPVQWNVVRSNGGVMRGVHVHVRHDDYLSLLAGRASIGLRDLRRSSATEGVSALIEMRGDELAGLLIPHGVAHGFYFHEPSVHIYAVSHYWDLSDELGCRWSDPALEIPWPIAEAAVSERDSTAPPLADLLAQLEPFQPIATAFPATAD